MFVLISLRNLLMKYGGFYGAVIEIKRLIETNRTRINAAHVIVKVNQ